MVVFRRYFIDILHLLGWYFKSIINWILSVEYLYGKVSGKCLKVDKMVSLGYILHMRGQDMSSRYRSSRDRSSQNMSSQDRSSQDREIYYKSSQDRSFQDSQVRTSQVRISQPQDFSESRFVWQNFFQQNIFSFQNLFFVRQNFTWLKNVSDPLFLGPKIFLYSNFFHPGFFQLQIFGHKFLELLIFYSLDLEDCSFKMKAF